MKYHDQRAEGIALLRAHARQSATHGKGVRLAYAELRAATDALLSEFRCEFDFPGVRYWEHPESRHFFSTMPGEHIDPSVISEYIELARHEFLGRQGIHNDAVDHI